MRFWDFFIKYFGIILSAGLGGFIGSLAMEKLKSYWDKKNKEHEVIFTKYHELQVVVLTGLYSELSKMELSIKQNLLNSIGSGTAYPGSDKKAAEEIAHFNAYFSENEIFIPEEIISKIKDIQKVLSNANLKLFFHALKGDSVEESIKYVAIEEYQKLEDNEFPWMKKELKKEIKKILSTSVQ